MTVAELQWLVGIAVTAVIAVASVAIGAFRAMSGRLESAMGRMEKAVKDGDDHLHERVNRLRQDVSDNYVRRVDLDGHLKRIDDTMKEVRDDQKKLIERVTLLTAGGGVRKRPQRRAATSS